jgi:pilus assembly protein Flp/PilA
VVISPSGGDPLSGLATNFSQTWSLRQARRCMVGKGAMLNSNPNLRSKKMIKNFLRDETGLELSEYAVAAALIALAVVGVFATLGNNISVVIQNLADKIKVN